MAPARGFRLGFPCMSWERAVWGRSRWSVGVTRGFEFLLFACHSPLALMGRPGPTPAAYRGPSTSSKDYSMVQSPPLPPVRESVRSTEPTLVLAFTLRPVGRLSAIPAGGSRSALALPSLGRDVGSPLSFSSSPASVNPLGDLGDNVGDISPESFRKLIG
jgi:hypothetical protein